MSTIKSLSLSYYYNLKAILIYKEKKEINLKTIHIYVLDHINITLNYVSIVGVRIIVKILQLLLFETITKEKIRYISLDISYHHLPNSVI